MSGREPSGARKAIAQQNLTAILDGAERLLRSGKALTFSAIAAEAGVSRPTVYAHFSDRAGLIAALVDRALREAVTALAAAQPDRGPPDEALRRVVTTGWEHLARHLEVARAAASDLPLDVLHQEHLEAERVIGSLIRRGQKESAFRDDLPAAWLASACLAVIHSAAARVNAGQMSTTSALDALLVTVVDLCVGPRPRRKRQR